jgi:hypothetical protein
MVELGYRDVEVMGQRMSEWVPHQKAWEGKWRRLSEWEGGWENGGVRTEARPQPKGLRKLLLRVLEQLVNHFVQLFLPNEANTNWPAKEKLSNGTIKSLYCQNCPLPTQIPCLYMESSKGLLSSLSAGPTFHFQLRSNSE